MKILKMSKARKAILLNTHADILKVISNLTIRSVDLKDEEDVKLFRNIQELLMCSSRMIEKNLRRKK